MAFADEVSRADAALSEAALALLSLPPTTRRRSALCLIKNMCAAPFPRCFFVRNTSRKVLPDIPRVRRCCPPRHHLLLPHHCPAAALQVKQSTLNAQPPMRNKLCSGRDGVEKKSVLELVNMSLLQFDALFREERSIVKDGMVSMEGDYGVFVTQAAAFNKVLLGAVLTSEEKDGLRHTVFYNAQFRADLHAAARANSVAASEPSTPSARVEAGAEDDCSQSSEDDDVTSAGAKSISAGTVDGNSHEPQDANVPASAAKAAVGRMEALGDETPSSVGFSDALSPYRSIVELNPCDNRQTSPFPSPALPSPPPPFRPFLQH
jgi:hypothetical protein